jgi:hypothetical protein
MSMPTARWRKSSYSGTGNNSACVEVAFGGPAAAVRDSKNAAGPVLVFPGGSWAEFLTRGAGR